MPDGQAPRGSPWRSRPPRERPAPGPRRCPAPLLETEKSSSVRSFHWKEEQLLRRQLGLLDAMKRHEASVRLTEQKAFYRRCHAQLQRAELARARLRGDRGPARQLGGQGRWSRPPGPADESGAALRALLRGRPGGEAVTGPGSRPCSLEAIAHRTPLAPGGGRPAGEDSAGARAASSTTRGAVQAQEPWWVLAVDAQSRPAPQGEPPAPDAPGPRQPEGKLLLYVIREEELGEEEQPHKKRPRPRDKPRSPPGPRRGVPRE